MTARPLGAPSPYGRQWRKLRLYVLERDGYQCQMGLIGCTGQATTVDHVTPLAYGGPASHPANVRAACVSCNSRAGGRIGNARARAALRARAVSARGSRAW